ncbi:protein kinase [Streptosporangium sp. NBC_01755]|uniref:serine/threonine protein kinase n=1 Tax=Streptosporangium sp. NBC_01755 TaxID=2975949 RepID=UPI002DDC358D|nr:protein kinase [Streptosporangium sp. NBC_01755]WSD00700.1 protein kinase [Streptosporangium sp. NBC_01755]
MEPLTAEDPPRLGSFELTGRLGEGGQGIVYLGRGPEGEQVAVKLLHHGLAGDPEARARFLREVSVAQRVARFCTASVLHADLAGSRPYIVSEYVPGPSLRQLVDSQGPRRGASLERLAVSTATALSAIHRAGILHRDFKPANVLMGPEGPVVIDFGIARALDSPGMTATGVAMGTPSYLAPEQLGPGEVTPAADVFAWGVTMVFAATGTPAFGQDSIPVVINRILNTEPELGALEGELRELVAACLSKDPALRPTAEQLVNRLMGTAPTTPVRRPAPLTGPAPDPGHMSAAAMWQSGQRQDGPPAGGPGDIAPGQSGPGHGGPGHGGSGQDGSGRRKARGPVGLLLTGVAVVATLGVAAAGTVTVLQNDEKTAVARAGAASAAAETSRPAPASVTDGPPTAGKKPPLPSEIGEDAEEVSPITPPPSRRIARPSSRPAENPNSDAGKPTREPTRPPSRTPNPAAGTAKPTPSANPSDPDNAIKPSSASEPTSKPTPKPTTARPTARPTTTVKPSPKPTPQKPNPYTATGVCGSGYKVVNSRALGGVATIYLLYNSAAGKNCVVTMSRYVVPAKVAMNAILQVQGGSSGSNPGRFTVYAGPVRLSAAKKCVIWGGSHGSLSWKSGWSHCG